MAVLKNLEFLVVRYVPNSIRGEFVNIGVVMFESSLDGFADVLFTRDWRRLRCLDPDMDLDVLLALEGSLRVQLRDTADRRTVLEKLESLLSNAVQLSTRTACLAEDPAEELRQVEKIYCEATTPAPARPSSGRQRILKTMQSAFEQAGVLGLLHKEIPAARYTAQGDPLKIDFGYKPNGILKMLQAVSLSTSVDPAKALAFSFGQMKSGAKDLGETLALTAVVDDDLDSTDVHISFALAALKKAEIEVRKMAEMADIAEGIRAELRA